MRRALPLVAAAALAVAVVVGLSQAGSPEDARTARFDLDRALASLKGAPASLARLHARSSRLLDGGAKALRSELAGLKGHGVVVNKWASWCGPCRLEFPHFQSQATKRGRTVAFLGLNSGDNRADAQKFLAEFPVPFPSYVDRDHKIANGLGGGRFFPVTIFYDAQGRRAFVHQGQYRTEADLAADIDRYIG